MIKNRNNNQQYSPDYFDNIAESFSQVAEDVFSPLYREIVEYVETEGHPPGIFVDLGTGTGMLAIELATRTGSVVIALDYSLKMLQILLKKLRKGALSVLVDPILADVHALPFRNCSIALAVSRGSAPFWHNRTLAFSMIYKSLKEGGLMFIGGGLGMSEETRRKVKEAMRCNDRLSRFAPSTFNPDTLRSEAAASGVPAEVLWGEFGLWIKARKLDNCKGP